MLIDCICGESKFAINAEQIGFDGRLVKCGKCGKEWFQESKQEVIEKKLINLDQSLHAKEITLVDDKNYYSDKISSNRSFGLVFFVVFLFIALWPLKYEEDIRLWSLTLSIIFFILGIFNSKLLTPLNKLWFKFGILLGSIVSPLIMGIVYFLVVTPMGVLMRLLGKDLLKMNKIKNASTYWIKRDKEQSRMKKQF